MLFLSSLRRCALMCAVLLSGSALHAQETPQSGPNFAVNTVDDHDDDVCGVSDCTLREAIDAANGNADASAITFDPAAFASKTTLTLTGDLPFLNSPLTITGSAAGVTLSNAFFGQNGGGTLTAQSGTATITNLSFAGNVYYAVRNYNANLTVRGCTFTNNLRGIGALGGTTTVQNCTLANHTQYSILSQGSPTAPTSVSVTSSTLSGNAQGLFMLSDSSVTLSNSILAGNTQNVGQGIFQDGGFNLVRNTAAQAGLKTDSDGKPVLADNGGPTQSIALVAGSAAIDGGNSTFATDQRGIARPIDFPSLPTAQGGNNSDIGAFEIELNETPQSGPNFIVNTVDDHDDDVCGLSDCTLREAIATANGNSDPSAITFDASVFANKTTLTLTGDLPFLNSPITITGTSAGVTLSNAFFGQNGGGTLTAQSGTATIANLTFAGNVYYAVRNYQANLTVRGCTFTNNLRAIGAFGGTTNVQNCTLANHTQYSILSSGTSTAPANVIVTNCTISGNGQGLFILSGSTFSLSNTILAGNSQNVGQGAFQDGGFNLVRNTAAEAGLQTDSDGKPVLADNGGSTQTIALVAGSAAIDGGNSTFTTDQRGVGRAIDFPSFANAQGGNSSDIGAFELELSGTPQSGPNFVVNTVEDYNDGVCGTEDCTLREAIEAANGNADASAITFDPTAFASKTTLTLTGDLPFLNSPITITGTAAGVTLSNAFFGQNGGGTVTAQSASATIVNLTFAGNVYYAVRNYQANLTVRGCTFTNNLRAIAAFGGTTNVQNCTLANHTQYAILASGTPTAPPNVIVTSCTISGNGQGFYILSDSSVTLSNSILAGNTQNVGMGAFQDGGFNLIRNTAAEAGLQTDGDGKPALADNGGPTQTIALMFGSAAINQGSAALGTDQRGIARPQRGTHDIGAFEYQNTAPNISTAAINNQNPKTGDTLTATPSQTAPGSTSDPDGDTFSFSYVWKNGNTVLSETGPTLDLSTPGNGNRGDNITVTVTATDLFGGSSVPVTSGAVTVQNSVPVVEGVTITPTLPSTTATANVTTSDADDDELTLSYQWQKNDVDIVGATGATLDLSTFSQVEAGDTIRVIVTAHEGSDSGDLSSLPFTSARSTIGNLLPSVVAVSPLGASDAVGAKRVFALTVSDRNSTQDISEMWLLVNTRFDWAEGATLVYFPKSGELYLRRGDDFLPPIKIGAAAGASDVLDNGALRIVGSEVSVTAGADGNTLTLSIPATVRDGLVGQNTLFARVQDASGGVDANSLAGEFGFVRFGPYTVIPQFAGSINSIPMLSALSPRAAFTAIPTTGARLQTFVFYAKDEDGIGDLDSLWFMAGKKRDWTGSATFVFLPRTRRLYLRSDDGLSFLGGGQIGTSGTIENSQVSVNLSQVQYLIYGDGKTVGLRLTLQPKLGLLGQNQIWLRVQDNAGATSTGGDDVGFVQSGTWNVTRQSSSTVNGASPSAPGS